MVEGFRTLEIPKLSLSLLYIPKKIPPFLPRVAKLSLIIFQKNFTLSTEYVIFNSRKQIMLKTIEIKERGKMREFSIDELSLLKDVTNRVRGEISSDLSQLVDGAIPRDIMFEACADRLSDFADSLKEKKVVKEFLSLGFKEMSKLAPELLPFSHYD